MVNLLGLARYLVANLGLQGKLGGSMSMTSDQTRSKGLMGPPSKYQIQVLWG